MDKPIVLIVDDEPLIAAMVEVTFEDAGFEVCSVMTAVEAITVVEGLGSRLAAVVTDIQLGDGANGWSVAVDARTKLPLVPVVYMTGDSAADWTAFGVPKSVLVQKPFAGAQVLAAVTTLMNSDTSDLPGAS
jgi:DNA-binding response OmpR family regulator